MRLKNDAPAIKIRRRAGLEARVEADISLNEYRLPAPDAGICSLQRKNRRNAEKCVGLHAAARGDAYRRITGIAQTIKTFAVVSHPRRRHLRAVQQNEGGVLPGKMKIADDVLKYQSARARIGAVVVVGDESRKQCARSRVALRVVRHAFLRGVVCEAVARQQIDIDIADAAEGLYVADLHIAVGSRAAAHGVAVGELNLNVRSRINAHRDQHRRLLRVTFVCRIRRQHRGNVQTGGVVVEVGTQQCAVVVDSLNIKVALHTNVKGSAPAARRGDGKQRIGNGARQHRQRMQKPDRCRCRRQPAAILHKRLRENKGGVDKLHRQRARHRPCPIISGDGHRNRARASAECAHFAAADNEVRARE